MLPKRFQLIRKLALYQVTTWKSLALVLFPLFFRVPFAHLNPPKCRENGVKFPYYIHIISFIQAHVAGDVAIDPEE